MVKPPKTMQPESVDLSKVKSVRGFQQDGFHHYMARKIALQRQQFGQVGPPPPPPTTTTTTKKKTIPNHQPPSKKVRFDIQTIATPKSDVGVILDHFHRRHGKLKRLAKRKRKRQQRKQPPSPQPPSPQPKESPATAVKESPSHRPDLFFQGIIIKVNGYTDPDNERLKRMIQAHGGDLECYETERVTHLIAQNLSTAKANMYKKQKNPKPVVHPSWIVDCVQQHTLLPYANYILQELLQEDGSGKYQQQGIQQLFLDHSNSTNTTIQNKNNNNLTKVEPRMLSPQKMTGHHPKPSPDKKSPPWSRTNDKLINGKIRTVGTDPNFLESYFRNSRLSFIGSYKQRASHTASTTIIAKKNHSLKPFIFHVDMDCFFASVALRNFPQYKDKPVVICHHGTKIQDNHSNHYPPETPILSKTSRSECATCNYKARTYGIKKGMFLGTAKELCPDLIALNYDFQGYEEVSEQVTEILYRLASKHKGAVETVSCDEAYLELQLRDHRQAREIAEGLRTQIHQVTDCTASVGVADNKFLAKLGTDRAKPNGSFVVTDHNTLLRDLKLRDLHGIGYRTEPKLATAGLVWVRDVWKLGATSTEVLTQLLGPGLGTKIGKYCQGQDDRPVEPAQRKTIGAECNYGVRFDGPYGMDHFMKGLATEVQRRMELVGVKGRRITLKAKQRKEGAGKPGKFLGHGSCHNLSKSLQVPGPVATCDANIISNIGMILFKELMVPCEDLRGMGIIVSKLTTNQQQQQQQSSRDLLNWFPVQNETKDSKVSPTSIYDEPSKEESNEIRNDTVTANAVREENRTNTESKQESGSFTQIALPPMSQIRMSQVEELPLDLQQQILSRMKEARSVDRLPQTNFKGMLNAAVSSNILENPELPPKILREIANGSMENNMSFQSNNQIIDIAHDEDEQLLRGSTNSVTEKTKMDAYLQSPTTLSLQGGRRSDTTKRITYKEPPANLFNEDIHPLKLFLDENSSIDPDAVHLVIEFLTICLQEGRSRDMVTMVRCIRNREDGWSDNVILKEEIGPALDQEYRALHGTSLDIEWLLS